MRVLMVVAPRGFRDEELFIPRAALEQALHDVTIGSRRPGLCKGTLGGTITAAVPLRGIDPASYDAAVFVGGPGARAFFSDRDALRIARTMAEAGKVTAAICIAPVILARAGVLRGKEATVFHTEVPTLVAAGATVRALGVVTDGNLVTANGPESAAPFASAVLAALHAHAGREVASVGSERTAATR